MEHSLENWDVKVSTPEELRSILDNDSHPPETVIYTAIPGVSRLSTKRVELILRENFLVENSKKFLTSITLENSYEDDFRDKIFASSIKSYSKNELKNQANKKPFYYEILKKKRRK